MLSISEEIHKLTICHVLDRALFVGCNPMCIVALLHVEPVKPNDISFSLTLEDHFHFQVDFDQIEDIRH
jgi:hypothetical protein